MKKIIFIVAAFLLVGCSSKTIEKKPIIQMQKQDANKAWQKLDKW
jgi:uncharacterized protein YcfL